MFLCVPPCAHLLVSVCVFVFACVCECEGEQAARAAAWRLRRLSDPSIARVGRIGHSFWLTISIMIPHPDEFDSPAEYSLQNTISRASSGAQTVAISVAKTDDVNHETLLTTIHE